MQSPQNQEHIQRSAGLNASERYLKVLCDRTFLSLWSYPNIWRDQGGARAGRGKEVCDLLVVFENHAIIFSDKSSEFPNSGNLEQDWQRWFKRTIEKASSQIWGAERWIKSFPERLFIDQDCTIRFPVELPPSDSLQIHRIVVAHGASQACREFFGGGSGSLIIDTKLVGDDHYLPFDKGGCPFAIGQVDPSKGYIHVLDDTTLDIVLGTLDTITDFVRYFTRKEAFLQSQNLYMPGEEELLALYLMNLGSDGEHDFNLPSGYDGIAVGEGYWHDFQNSSQRRSQIEANKVSYAWDRLLERFNYYLLNGARQFGTFPGSGDSEIAHRFLARECRTRRRMLSETLLDAVANTASNQRLARVVLPSDEGDPFYLFLVIPDFRVVT